MSKRTKNIICAACRLEIEAGSETCSRCKARPLLDGRYELLGELGKGASGVTWRARRADDGRLLAIKERLVQDARSFRELERLKREGDFLASLSHPQIPRLVEHFLVEEGRRSGFYLVTELIRGRTLADEMKGPRTDVRNVLEDLASVCDVLAYLHSRSPAVVHGDVKPENVVRRGADGALFLVDFHAAREFPSNETAGMTTAVGTPGFMAPEQLTGHVEPRTDIHAAACVAVALLTRRPLYTLVDDDFRLKWRKAVNVPKPVENLLGRMLEPSLSKRAKDAAALAREARLLARARPARRFVGGASLVAGAGAILGGAILMKAWSSSAATIGSEAAKGPAAIGALSGALTKLDARSKCEIEGRCSRLGKGTLAEKVRNACAEVKKGTLGPIQHFDVVLANEGGSCAAGYSGQDCVATCTFSPGVDDNAAIKEITRLKTWLSDTYGRPTSASPRMRLDGKVFPHWDWKDPGETHTKGIWTMSAEIGGSVSSANARNIVLSILAPC